MSASLSIREQRLATVLQLIRASGGQWTVGRLLKHRRANDGPPLRNTARYDLAELHRRGHLDRWGPDSRRHYTLKKDNA